MEENIIFFSLLSNWGFFFFFFSIFFFIIYYKFQLAIFFVFLLISLLLLILVVSLVRKHTHIYTLMLFTHTKLLSIFFLAFWFMLNDFVVVSRFMWEYFCLINFIYLLFENMGNAVIETPLFHVLLILLLLFVSKNANFLPSNGELSQGVPH